MSLKKQLLKIAGKDDFVLDSRVGNQYILHLCWYYGWEMIRGFILSIGNTNINRNIFIGKHVRILEKKSLFIGNKTKIHEHVYIDALSLDGIRLGNNVVIGRNSRIECTGSIKNIGKGISIGDRSTFGSDCYFGAAGGITIGNDVIAGQNIRFHAENHNYDDLDLLIKEQGVMHKGIKIGNNCWIGSGVVFLDGAQLGDGCVVAANAVVAKSFSENSVIGGIPAKLIKVRGK